MTSYAEWYKEVDAAWKKKEKPMSDESKNRYGIGDRAKEFWYLDEPKEGPHEPQGSDLEGTGGPVDARILVGPVDRGVLPVSRPIPGCECMACKIAATTAYDLAPAAATDTWKVDPQPIIVKE